MPASKYTEKQKAEALRLVVDVGPSEAARRTGVPKGTVSSWAYRAGVQTLAAHHAREAHETVAARNALRRAALADGLLDDALRLRGQLFSPTVAFNFGGKDNTYEEHAQPEPTFKDKQCLVNAIGTAVKTALEAERFDADDSGERTALTEWLKIVRGE